jgi:general secretion pathway protein G
MSNRIRKGFTLVELLIVVVILGILAAVVVPQFTNATSEATAGNLRAQLTSIQNQIELYAARNNGTYPFPTAAGAATWTNLTTSGAYLKAAPVNPAFTGATKTGIETAIGTVKGSAANAWVWNSADRTLYASFFNEGTGVVSTTATD